jgi:hypothetical protein
MYLYMYGSRAIQFRRRKVAKINSWSSGIVEF